MKLFHLPPSTAFFHSPRSLLRLVVCLGFLIFQPLFAAWGEDSQLTQAVFQPPPSPKTRTVVADLLMVDGAFYVIRGERGEIRIEVTPETQLSETFKFGDRIKAILLPNDEALSITRAQPGESVGTSSVAPTSSPVQAVPSSSHSSPSAKTVTPLPVPSPPKEPDIRIIIADLLMVDGNLYIIRSDYGEIQIEVTPQTVLSESFKFGDRIKARVTAEDRALSIVRAKPGETPGIRLEEAARPLTPTAPPVALAPALESAPPTKDSPEKVTPKESPKIRTVVAEVLMIDGAFYVVRGDRGEIRIEVTPKTILSESLKFGDKIKARILPNDTALSIERAKPDEPFGVQGP